MLQLIAILLVIWLVLTLIGVIFKGLLWLAIIGVILFLATALWGWWQKQKSP
ncbi:hypothetical protein ACFOVU_08985 [Nocardiopsis sediminis]|uniref:Hydrophobic protein n=1 Tax=Nocardiopsis sediminis TaxID=1778267 RepID=A0ABV8FN39_9ACTN